MENTEVEPAPIVPYPFDVGCVTPKLVFIIPYRDREQQQHFFAKHMAYVLSDMSPDDYKLYYIHQCDTRDFNRGAMKNIGFLMLKAKYPDTYQTITIVLNDVDTMPYTKGFLNYETTPGNVKHFYGFKNTLGGIVSINAGDFERINGFPNFWAWGYEDNLLQLRVERANLTIDRSQFYHIMDKNIMQMKDDIYRIINRTEFKQFTINTAEGINSIQQLEYTIDESTGFVNVTQFSTGRDENKETNIQYDLRKGSQPFKNTPTRKRSSFGNMMLQDKMYHIAMTNQPQMNPIPQSMIPSPKKGKSNFKLQMKINM